MRLVISVLLLSATLVTLGCKSPPNQSSVAHQDGAGNQALTGEQIALQKLAALPPDEQARVKEFGALIAGSIATYAKDKQATKQRMVELTQFVLTRGRFEAEAAKDRGKAQQMLAELLWLLPQVRERDPQMLKDVYSSAFDRRSGGRVDFEQFSSIGYYAGATAELAIGGALTYFGYMAFDAVSRTPMGGRGSDVILTLPAGVLLAGLGLLVKGAIDISHSGNSFEKIVTGSDPIPPESYQRRLEWNEP